MNQILRCVHLNYPPVFEKLDLSIEKGRITAISGSNNCGKTTLIKILSGLIPTREMICLGHAYAEMENKKKWYQQVQVILAQETFCFLRPTVLEELLFPLENLGMDPKEIQAKGIKWGNEFQLQSLFSKNPNELDHFEKLRLQIATSTISDPEILLLDDPFLFLDDEERMCLIVLLHRLKKKGMTIVLTASHLEDTVYADQLYILKDGKVTLKGTPLEVYQNEETLSQIGLSLPFLADLSWKLKFYNLLDEMILDEEKLVDTLWK